MKKLITYPDVIDGILKEYKKTTGISVTNYIQRAIYKAMIHDKLINIKRTDIYLDKKTGKVVNDYIEKIYVDHDTGDIINSFVEKRKGK